MAFDENKYKSIFESRFGSGSYESGLANARKMGQLKAQAGIAKQQFDSYVSEQKKAQKTAETKAKKKTYTDAISFWNDPTNSETLRSKGVYRTEQEIRNDPRKKQEIKDAGFNIDDFIDGMYNAGTKGESRSKREYDQKSNKKSQNVPEYDVEDPQSIVPMLKKKKQQSLLPPVKKKAKKKDDSILTDVKNFFTSKDTNGDGQRDGLLGLADRYVLPISQAATEVLLPGNEEKQIENDKAQNKGKVTNPALKAGMVDRGTETKVLHGIGTTLGYVAPYEGGYKAAGALNLLPKIASKVTNPYAQKAIRGAVAGTIAEGGLAAENELVNPNANNASDYAKRITIGAAGGAIGDPLLHGLGQGIQSGLSRFAKGNIPTFTGNASQGVLDNLAPKATPRIDRSNNLYDSLILKAKNPVPANVLADSKPGLQQGLNTFRQAEQIPLTPNINQLPVKLETINPMGNEYQKEFRDAVQQQYEYLKNSMGKGVEYGTTGTGLGNFREVNGSFSVSRNPKWYQDFYKQNGRKPNNEELRQLAAQHVKEGFQDEVGNLPAWQPKKIQEIDDQIEEIQSMLKENPEQEAVFKPVLDGLQEDREAILNEVETALKNPSVPTMNELKTPKPEVQKPIPVQNPAVNEVPKVATQIELPPKKPNERSFYSTVQNPDKLSPELKQKLEGFDKTYTPMSNQELVDHANEYVKNDIEKAYQFLKNANKFDPRHITVGHRLIDELQKAGQYDKALDVVERLAEQGTKAGQSIQSYSIYNRLTAEGQLLRAQRRINKVNESIADPTKQVKLTEQNIQDITHTADSIQKMNGQMEQANNVIKIMESLKKGKMATDAELETVRSFVSDAKKFVGDFDPKAAPPKVKPVKDVRTRDKVVDFMDKKEQVAREELKKILGRANSMPVDALYHLSTIGASKIAKGTVKLTDFTEEMVKDFGDVVRPYAKQIYNKAVETFNLQSESMTQKRLSEVERITNRALKDKNLSADEVDTIKEFARKVGMMSGDAKIEHSMELQSILQDLERPTFGQKLSAAQTIAQLLNPKTVVRNALGNEMFYRVEQMNKLLATPIDIVRSKITGGDRTITFVTHNQGQYWRNWLTGAKAGWKGVNPMGLQTQYDLGPQAFRSKVESINLF
jgi:hypothetical protein